MIVSSYEERTADGPFVVLAEDKQAAEEEFTGGFETGEEAGDQIGRLERQAEFLRVLKIVSTYIKTKSGVWG